MLSYTNLYLRKYFSLLALLHILYSISNYVITLSNMTKIVPTFLTCSRNHVPNERISDMISVMVLERDHDSFVIMH